MTREALFTVHDGTELKSPLMLEALGHISTLYPGARLGEPEFVDMPGLLYGRAVRVEIHDA